MDQNRLALLALHFIPGVGSHTIRQLVSYCGSADKVFLTPKGKLLKIPGIGEVLANAIRAAKPFPLAEQELQKASRENAQLVFYTDKNYPSRLRQLNDAPSLLYLQGDIDLNPSKTIAVVGTRKATDYGKLCVDELLKALVPHQPLIISGLAYGIDIHAHKQALKNKLPTVGILGSGLDVIYPAAHRDTARRMMKLGGLVTENPFGTKPDAHNFPARNRIIAGLADALVVVEAAESGGALITADIANSYNKDVFAFPGNIGRAYSEGCNTLIKQNKASLITSAQDIEYLLNWTADDKVKSIPATDLDNLEPEERGVVETLRANNNQLPIDDLTWRCGLPASKLAGVLLALELKGVLVTLPGKIYRLK